MSVLRRWFCCVVDCLFIVTPIVWVCNCSMICCTLLYVLSSIAIFLMGEGELVALRNFSSWCLVMVEWLFLAMPWGCLQFVIVVFPDHTHLLFWTSWVQYLYKVRKKANIRNQYNQIPHIPPGHHIEKWQKHKKTSHTREPRVQLFPSRGP